MEPNPYEPPFVLNDSAIASRSNPSRLLFIALGVILVAASILPISGVIIGGVHVLIGLAFVTPLMLVAASSIWHGLQRSKFTAALLIATANLFACTLIVLLLDATPAIKTFAVCTMAAVAATMIAHYVAPSPLTRRLLAAVVFIATCEVIVIASRWIPGWH